MGGWGDKVDHPEDQSIAESMARLIEAQTHLPRIYLLERGHELHGIPSVLLEAVESERIVGITGDPLAVLLYPVIYSLSETRI